MGENLSLDVWHSVGHQASYFSVMTKLRQIWDETILGTSSSAGQKLKIVLLQHKPQGPVHLKATRIPVVSAIIPVDVVDTRKSRVDISGMVSYSSSKHDHDEAKQFGHSWMSPGRMRISESTLQLSWHIEPGHWPHAKEGQVSPWLRAGVCQRWLCNF